MDWAMVTTKRLTEYLAVLAICAILAAVLFPVFATSTRGGPGTRCLSNIKQLTLGHLMYASDNDGRFTFAPIWQAALFPYVKSEFACPLAPGKRYGYAMLDERSGAKTTSFKEPATVPLMIESSACIPNAHGPLSLIPNPGRHGGRNYVGYVDGHAKRLPLARPERE
jgi:prepilin-type processing-associated H-X9-DG protein